MKNSNLRETRFHAEDQFLSLLSKTLCVPDRSDEIVSLFYKCMRLSYEEGFDDGKFETYRRMEKEIGAYPDEEDLYV